MDRFVKINAGFYLSRRKALVGLAAACAVARESFAQQPAAQGYPNRPIRWIVPYAAGGGTDSIARLYGQEMERVLKQPFIVDNRPGASTLIGVQALLAAPADGYTIFAGNDSLASNLYLLDKVPYTLNDFVGVSVLAKGMLALVSRLDYPAKNATEALRHIKANDGKLAYGSWGVGGMAHLAMEALLERIGVTMTHVPFAGAAPAINSMLGGQMDIMLTDLPTALQFVKAGKLKLWAVASKERHPSFPDVPTIAESGYPGYDWFAWIGILAKKGTPMEALNKMSASVAEAVRNRDFRQDQLDRGNVPWGSSPKELEDLLAMNATNAKALIDKRGIKLK